jgi:hypothetical protein
MAVARNKKVVLAEPIEGAPLQSAPENELGVVFLFSRVLKKHGLKVQEIKASFPDCIALQIASPYKR